MKSYVIVISLLWCEVFVFLFLISGLIIGTIGGYDYIKNRHDQRLYRSWKTLCLVRNYTLKRCDCKLFNDFCKLYPCFNEEFLVDYEIFNETIVTSYIHAKNQINYHKDLTIGKNATCYYNGRYNITSVKWSYGDKTFGFILFCFGYGIVAIDLPIIIIILICLKKERRYHKQKLVKNEMEYSTDIL